MKHNFITELFLYFAKFPNHNNIYNLFNIGESTIPGYNELRTSIDQMQQHSLTTIDNYIFGANQIAVLNRINNIPAGKSFLFVDFGEIDFDTDSRNRYTDTSKLAISVAYRVKSYSADLIEQTLIFDKTLTMLTHIRNQMLHEQDNHPWLKKISERHLMVPFISPEMTSLGWSLIFQREGYDSFNVKI